MIKYVRYYRFTYNPLDDVVLVRVDKVVPYLQGYLDLSHDSITVNGYFDVSIKEDEAPECFQLSDWKRSLALDEFRIMFSYKYE